MSSSTRTDPATTIATGEADGFIFRVDPGGAARIVAESVAWPNCMTFDDGERHLYACRSSMSDVARFEVLDGGAGLGPAQRYGPPLGDRREDEFGLDQLAAFGRPEVLARWGLTDGCGFDAEGNLWVTVLSSNRIVAITPDGDVVTVVDDPDGELVASPTERRLGRGGPPGFVHRLAGQRLRGHGAESGPGPAIPVLKNRKSEDRIRRPSLKTENPKTESEDRVSRAVPPGGFQVSIDWSPRSASSKQALDKDPGPGKDSADIKNVRSRMGPRPRTASTSGGNHAMRVDGGATHAFVGVDATALGLPSGVSG